MSCGCQPLYSVRQEPDFGERGSCFFLCCYINKNDNISCQKRTLHSARNIGCGGCYVLYFIVVNGVWKWYNERKMNGLWK